MFLQNIINSNNTYSTSISQQNPMQKPISMKKNHLKISNMPAQQILKLKKTNIQEQFPQNCICYIKIKICDENIKFHTVKGSGIMISKEIILTAAHNVYDHKEKIEHLINLKKKVNDQSYVKIALCEGDSNGVYDIQWIKISESYISFRSNENNPNNIIQKTKQECFQDYAILKIHPRKNSKFQQILQFPIPLAIEDTQILKQPIIICGYPIMPNKMNYQQQGYSNSSIFMQDAFEAQGKIMKFPWDEEQSDNKKKKMKYIEYDIPTDMGTSGSGILTKFKEKDVVIGIHKAGRNQKSTHVPAANVGIKLTTAIKEINNWGYQYHRKPFIFTEKTMYLHDNPTIIDKSQNLFFLDNKLQTIDIYVISSYDISHIRKIFLSGSKIRDEGFKILTNRKFNQLQTLFLSQNHLRNLNDVPEQNWKNISTLKNLGLNINKLTLFPEKLKYLENLQQLWLSYNRMEKITDKFINFCQERATKVKIHMQENKFDYSKPDIIEAKRIIENTKVQCTWNKIKK